MPRQERPPQNDRKSGAHGRPVAELIPAPHIRNAALVADHNNLRAALDRLSIIAASRRSPPRSGLREDNLADAVAVADRHSLTCASTPVISVSADVHHTLMRQQHLEEHRPQQPSANQAASHRQQQNQRSNKSAVAMQQIASAAEPAEKRR